jgi:predicted HicB family RNase H-like nuclease
MANEFFTHKNYSGSVETSIEDQCLHGKILFIDDLITYEAETVPGLNIAFNEAVDRYLDYCKRTEKPANKAYSGSFNVRVGVERHRALAQKAYCQGVNINEAIGMALDAWLKPAGAAHTHNHIHLHVEDYQKIEPIAFSGEMQPYQTVVSHAQH